MFTIPDHITAIIFDCDGTLADTIGMHKKAWTKALSEVGSEVPKNFFNTRSGMPSFQIVQEMNKLLGTSYNAKELAERKENLLFEYLDGVTAIQPVVDVALNLRASYPMGVASGGARKNVLATLEAINLATHFDIIVTACDDVLAKPAPEIFLHVAEVLKTPAEQCLVFEDGDMGIKAAEAAGMALIDVRDYL